MKRLLLAIVSLLPAQRILPVLSLLLWPASVSAQLPHNVPDFCAGSSSNVAAGESRTIANATYDCFGVHGTVVLTGTLRATNILVYEDGFLDVQSGASIVIRNTPLKGGSDPESFGTGLIVLGRLRMLGVEKTPFVRVASEPLAGQTQVTLSSTPSGWLVGDEVFLPDARQVDISNWFNANYALHHETRTITAIAGTAVTLDAPLSFDHRGARDANGVPTVLAGGKKLLPHLANLTRSITLRSENPNGTRGHVLLTHRAQVEIRGTVFRDLGRTTTASVTTGPPNQIGRYPLHVHHLQGPVNPTNTGYQFQLVGNVIRDSLKWPMAIHGSHYGLIADNVIVGGPQLTGSGMAFENGTETLNEVRNNFVADIRGHENPRNTGSALGDAAGSGQAPPSDGTHAGSGGECYWTAGFNTRFIGNVAAGCRNAAQNIVAGVGWKMFVPPAPSATRVRVPRFRGDDPASYVEVTAQHIAIPEFRDNEAYGLMADGLTIWHLGTDGYGWNAGQAESLIRNFTVWHAYESGVWLYPTNRVTIENLAFRFDDAVSTYFNEAITGGDYRQLNLTVRGGDLHVRTIFGETIDPLGTWRLENIRATTKQHAFVFQTPATPGTQAGRSDGVTVQLVNPQITPWPGQPLRTISMSHRTDKQPAWTSQPYTVNLTEGPSVRRVCFSIQETQNLYGGTCQGSTRSDINGIVGGSAPAPPSPTPPGPAPPDPDPSLTTNPPHYGHLPYCNGQNCVPIAVPMMRNEAHSLPSSSTPNPKRTAGDYDGDAKADPTAFNASSGVWYTLTSRSEFAQAIGRSFGGVGYVPVPGDYDGDGRTDRALYQASEGVWLVTESRNVFSTVRSYSFGASEDDVPVPADYDGDRVTDPAVFRPSAGTWYIRYSRSGFTNVSTHRWGGDGDLVASADFDGDGRADPAVYRPSTGTWHVLTSTTGFGLALEYRFGGDGDLPVPADYDGDGRADLATYHPVFGVWRVLTSSSGFTQALVQTLGGEGDVAVPADYDGDGKADFSVYRPTTGAWILNVHPYALIMPPQSLPVR